MFMEPETADVGFDVRHVENKHKAPEAALDSPLPVLCGGRYHRSLNCHTLEVTETPPKEGHPTSQRNQDEV